MMVSVSKLGILIMAGFLLFPVSSVYGHGLISYKDFEKMIQRIELLEEKVKELRIHTNTNDNMDLLK